MSRRSTYVGGDSRTLQARAEGYPARSVFKLQEIDEKSKLLAPGQRVVDLGAAPGSWSLYAAKKVGPSGRVLALDLQEIKQVFPPQVTVVQGDAFSDHDGLHSAHGPYDVVLSDMAPNTTGDKYGDAVRSGELVRAALGVSLQHGKPGSHFVAKIFMGAEFESCRAEIQRHFETTKVARPKGVRDNSVEVFLVGLRKRPTAAP
jgi:23S rRNA (uridine2552-2'-O)-methyltransferase